MLAFLAAKPSRPSRHAHGTSRVDMTHGPLLGKILLFALPLALSGILQQLFNSADAAVVGQFVGDDALAAVGANTPVISMFVNLFVGLSVGANVVIAIFVGTHNRAKVREALHTAVALSLACGVALVLVGVAAARPILTLIDTPAESLDLAVLYLRIYFLGMPFAMFYNFASAILRSKGDTRRPLYALVVSTAVNLGLNLLFVAVFHWDVAGVAAATVVANAVSAGYLLRVLLAEEDEFALDVRAVRFTRVHLVNMVKIGLPAGLQGAIFSLSNVCIQAAINGFGYDAVAGSTASLNYEYFTFYLINAFAQTAVTFTSQNYALRQYDRCDRIMALCMVGSLLSSGAACVLFVHFGEFFVGVFATEATAVGYGLVRMRHVELFEFLGSSYEVSGGAMRGMGYSMLPAIITIVGSCLLRFAWVYLVFPRIGTWESLIDVYPVTWVVTGVSMLVAYAFIRRKAYRAHG